MGTCLAATGFSQMKLEGSNDMNEAMSRRPERSVEPLGEPGLGACSLEDMAERIGGVIAWVVVALRREVAEEALELDPAVADSVVRGWISGLNREARAYFLTLVLTDRCYAECPLIVRAILEGAAWPGDGHGGRSWGALDPGGCPCEAGPHAAGLGVRRGAGAGRVRWLAGRRDALRE